MAELVDYQLEGFVATITMDDGKANALSHAMLAELGAAFDQAEADAAIVVLTGRDGKFSAGFDLGCLKAGDKSAVEMVIGGFRLVRRIQANPRPVVVACSGHAIAMGVFLLVAGDYTVGVAGAAHRIVANEVGLGYTMPHTPIELGRNRLTPSALQRALSLAEEFTPETALAAGFLDKLVPAEELLTAAHSAATAFYKLDSAAHTGTKERIRHELLARLDEAIERDELDLRKYFGLL